MNIIVTCYAFMKYQNNFCESLACMQIAEKFLERPELASMSFQNDFLKPFVVVMRQSGAKEIRELIIRQVLRFILSYCLSRHVIRSSVVVQSSAILRFLRPLYGIDVRKSVANIVLAACNSSSASHALLCVAQALQAHHLPGASDFIVTSPLSMLSAKVQYVLFPQTWTTPTPCCCCCCCYCNASQRQCTRVLVHADHADLLLLRIRTSASAVSTCLRLGRALGLDPWLGIVQVSRMVLSQVHNVKSGWKSMFMVCIMTTLQASKKKYREVKRTLTHSADMSML